MSNLLPRSRCGEGAAALLAMLVFLGFSTSPAQALLVTGSEGLVNIIGNDAGNATGSFSVDAAYEMYDGNSGSDPLGVTNTWQLAFALHHLGSGGESPTLSFGRFTVFAPSPASTTVAYYSSLNVVNPISGTFLIGPTGNSIDPAGGHAPTSTNIDPPPTGPNRGKFMWQDGLLNPLFLSGERSQMLVLQIPRGSALPADVVIEIDATNTAPQVHGDTTIHIVPEPSALALLGMGVTVLTWRRRRAA
jgi:hypothetical protein